MSNKFKNEFLLVFIIMALAFIAQFYLSNYIVTDILNKAWKIVIFISTIFYIYRTLQGWGMTDFLIPIQTPTNLFIPKWVKPDRATQAQKNFTLITSLLLASASIYIIWNDFIK